FSFASSAAHRHLHSFPTRRSSDLGADRRRPEAPLLIPDHELFGGKNAERFPDRACAHVEFSSQRVDMDARSRRQGPGKYHLADLDRKSTRLNSSHVKISYAVFCLK